MKIELISDVSAYVSDIAGAEQICILQPWSKQALEEFISYEYNKALCVMVDGVFAGYVTYTTVCDEIQIANIATLPDFRRKGVASVLLEKINQIAENLKASVVTLEVRVTNIPAISLYEKHGYKVCGTRKGYYKNPTDDALLMNLWLK